MPLAPGTRLGHYEIVAPLGAGGMGEVYRARDTQLGRSVAIKALPAGFASDPERLARFEREARLLASLSHPNIAGIHGLIDEGGQRHLALELIEGESLAQRLARGPLPLDEALPVCEQIAAALEAAHEAGIVHRDLKPANVMIRADGSVKVLDFGLAKGPAGAEPASDLTQSPTLTSPMTSPGMILGTAAYMSPEQARGRAVDRRADAWAWGCVLYECLTGKRAFPGEDISETLAAILKDPPNWAALPADTPPPVRELLARCLTKDPRERQRDLGDARIELAAARREGPARAGAAATPRRWSMPQAVATLVAMLAIGLLAGLWVARLRAPATPLRRFEIVPPDQGVNVIYEGEYAISPDGRQLAATLADSSGTDALWVRSLESGEWRRLEGTSGADYPFWSPDSRDLAFFAHERLKRVPAAGGEPQDLCAAREPRGGAWSGTHEIIFAGAIFGPLLRIPDTGGAPVDIPHAPDRKAERYPTFLPDGIHFLYVSGRAHGPKSDAFLGSLRDTTHRLLVQEVDGMSFRAPDVILFRRNRTLFAQRFDLGRGETIGVPLNTGEHPSTNTQINLTPTCSVSLDGTMVYATRDRRTTDAVWCDRGGHPVRTIPLGLPGVFTGALNSDGRRLAVAADVEGPLVYVFDLPTGAGTALPGTENATGQQAWSPDGVRVGSGIWDVDQPLVAAFDATGNGRKDVLMARGTSAGFPLTFLRDWTHDGRTLVIGQSQPGTGWDIFTKSAGDTQAAVPYANTPAMEYDARISHDGHWLAYVSVVSGRPEIYVDTFPKPTGAHRLSFTGCSQGTGSDRLVWWRGDDREIEYVGPDRRTVYAAPVRTSPTLQLGTSRPLFVAPPGTLGVEPAPDGQGFYVFQPHGSFANTFTVVLGATAGGK